MNIPIDKVWPNSACIWETKRGISDCKRILYVRNSFEENSYHLLTRDIMGLMRPYTILEMDNEDTNNVG